MACLAVVGALALAATEKAEKAAPFELSPCLGEVREDFACTHDDTHRICATLLDGTAPLKWGATDFWKTTGQQGWADSITDKPNPGDSWCVCMWATAELITGVGFDNVHLNCTSSDIDYVLAAYEDGGADLAPAHKCLQAKCGADRSSAKLDARRLLKAKEAADLRKPRAPPIRSKKAGKKQQQQAKQHQALDAAVSASVQKDAEGVGGSDTPCEACMACLTSCFTQSPDECDAGACDFDDKKSCWSLSPVEGFDQCYGEGATCGEKAPKHRAKYDCRMAASSTA